MLLIKKKEEPNMCNVNSIQSLMNKDCRISHANIKVWLVMKEKGIVALSRKVLYVVLSTLAIVQTNV